MNSEAQQKATPEHLKKEAYLYVRQSTLRQVVENTESTERQYALRQRAIALGWPDEHVVVIDSDLGQSGASARDREGFQRLVTEVGMGHAGLVMGLEVSRLARNSSDWHRLLEICALTGTLILDEDGVYDPRSFNDRLLLGLKGTMSEAELHVLRARLRGGMLNKARRGELALRLPVGLVYSPAGKVVLNPDKQVQQSIRLLFDTFERVGSAHATVRFFSEQGLEFPKVLHCGPSKGEIVWRSLSSSHISEVLHSPRYAGAYCYGRRAQHQVGIDGRAVVQRLARERWYALIPNAHEGYISWQQYEKNLKQLEENAHGREFKRKYPPREGPALLQGLVVCGICGARMTVRYHAGSGRAHPNYLCKGAGNTQSRPNCQDIPGWGIDDAISRLLLEVMTPFALEVALAVQKELQDRIDEADGLRRKQVERARYEAELARRRYMQVDPDNRLVADELEAEWNNRLRELRQSQEEYERRREADRLILDDEAQAKILALASDFPRLWRDHKTPDRERKRMIRLLIEDVTLIKKDVITVGVRFKGGATRSLALPKPRQSWEEWTTPPEVLAHIDRLLDNHTNAEIADLLNEQGLLSGGRKRFHGDRVEKLARRYGLKDRHARLRERGLLSLEEISRELGVCKATVKLRRALGSLGVACYKLNDMGEYMYENPSAGRGESNDSYDSCRGGVV
jgi:DNA invertase Pin-like site-specific DNA recombinase